MTQAKVFNRWLSPVYHVEYRIDEKTSLNLKTTVGGNDRPILNSNKAREGRKLQMVAKRVKKIVSEMPTCYVQDDEYKYSLDFGSFE